MENTYGLENFTAVWERVSGAAQAGGNGSADALRAFLDAGAAAASLYRQVAARCTVRADAAILRSLSAEESARLAQLRACLFLLDGDSYVPPTPAVPPVSTLEALRMACIAERESAAAYRAAANTADTETAKLFFTLAGADTRHAETLQALLARALR